MKIVIACDSFKGSLTSEQAALHIENGIKKVCKNTEIIKVPIGDGGEGTSLALVSALNGKIIKKKIHGPLFEIIEGFYGILPDNTAVIEIAAACGLSLIKKENRNPMKTTSLGVGELILDALSKNIRKFIICLGGSSTNDAGCGMLSSLGIKFYDKNGNLVKPCGGELNKICRIDVKGMDKRLKNCTFTAACDVNNPLCGQNGASFVYGPQKGADKNMAEILDNNLFSFANTIKNTLGIDNINKNGAGAAGGLGYALFTFLNGNFKSGIDIVIEETKLKEKIKNADLIITGEGKIDSQTACGKAPLGISLLSKKNNIPVIAITGCIGDNINCLYDNFDSIFSIADKPMTAKYSINNAGMLLENTTERIMRLIMKVKWEDKNECN